MYWNQTWEITLYKSHGDSSTAAKMLKGMSNFQIESAIKNPNDKDINENFSGVYPVKHMNKFVDHKSLISRKMASI